MFDIIPNDGVDLEQITRGIYIGSLGNLHVRMIDGSEGTYGDLIAGIIHPLQIVRVFATGTTAADIRGIV
jgi:hypothetical protein